MRLGFGTLKIAMLAVLAALYPVAAAYLNMRLPGGFSALSYIPLGIIVFLLLYNLAGSTARRITIEYDGTVCGDIPITREYFYNALELTRTANNKLFAIGDLAVNVCEMRETLAKALPKGGYLGIEEEIAYAIRYFSRGEGFVGGETGIIGDTKNPERLVMRHDYDAVMDDETTGLPERDWRGDRVVLYGRGRWARKLAEGAKGSAGVKISALNIGSKERMLSGFRDFSKKSAALLFLMLSGRIVVEECFI